MEATMMCSENGFLFFLASSSKVPSAPSACSWAGLPKAHTPFLHTPPLIPGFPPDSSMAPDLHSAVFFLTVCQLSHPYMTTGKTIALTRWTFVDKVMSLLFNMLSRLVITFLPRSKRLLNSWLQSPSAVILEPKNKVCYN